MTDVLVAVGHHRPAAVPAAPADDVHLAREEGVGGADDGADVEVVVEVLDGDVERVPPRVEVVDDRLEAPVAVPVNDIPPVAVLEQLGIQPVVVGPRPRVRTDAHRHWCRRLFHAGDDSLTA